MNINYQDGLYTIDTFLEEILRKIDDVEVRHAKNWIALCEISSMIAAISAAIKKEEESHNEQKAKLLERIRELTVQHEHSYDDQGYGNTPGLDIERPDQVNVGC